MNAITNSLEAHAQGPVLTCMERVYGFPTNEPGIDKGVSACFAGTANGFLLMAGGCNFPETPAAEGGKKRYYKGIYAASLADNTDLQWKQIGSLPHECAYGVSIQLDNGLLCVGGNNHDSSLTDAFILSVNDGKAVLQQLPSLPFAMDNFTGCRRGNEIIVTNGKDICTLNLCHPEEGWSLIPIAGGTVLGQPVCGSAQGSFYLWGGCTAKKPEQPTTLHIDGDRFTDLTVGSTPVESPFDYDGNAIYLGGATAINLSADTIVAIGGVNKDIFLDAVNNPKPGYMTHPIEWYRFNPYISVFTEGRWHIAGKSQVTARAGAALAVFGNYIYIIGGELKPGIRTPEIYRMTIK
ncbi:cyclically-permuted mutarotase family protein [Prevotella sp.]|uniref:cyclically-permuted mutarotase family protein n=1 Tax=Prevotella sp. TaxID=59823 RepID=UPI002F939A5A